MKKPGCAATAGIVLLLLILLFLGANESLGYYLANCPEEDVFDCVMGAIEDPEPQGVVAVGTYSHKGYEVVVTMNIPLEGGQITGTVAGTCEGKITGNNNGGAVGGSMSGGCSPFIVNVPASATFNGTVNKTTKTVPINFSGKAPGYSKQDSMTLTYK